MTKRWKDDGWPSHPFIQGLSLRAEKLFDYLCFNPKSGPAGLYRITFETMAFESKLSRDKTWDEVLQEIPELLKEMEPNVKWYPEHKIIWVKEWLNNQYGISAPETPKQRTFLKKVANYLAAFHYPEIVKEFREYNLKRYNFDILSYADDNVFPFKPIQTIPTDDLNFHGMMKLYEEKTGKASSGFSQNDIQALNDIAETYSLEAFERVIDEYPGKPLSYLKKVLERWQGEGASPPSELTAPNKEGKINGVEIEN